MTDQSDFERDVQATLTSVATETRFPAAAIDRLVEAGRTRRGSVPAIRRTARRRWVAPLLAAAAVIALAVGLTTTQSHDSHSPVQQRTTTPPISTSTAPTPTPSGTATNAAPAVKTKKLTVQVGSQPRYVTVTVPTNWQVSQTQPKACCDTPPTTCLVSGRTDWANNPDNCVLAITWGGVLQDPDFPLPYPNASCSNWTTTEESSGDIQGRPGQYREFTDKCTGVRSEMWMTMSGPQIAFWHPILNVSTHATVAAIVASAVLPAVTDSRRQFDEGYVTNVTRSGATYLVTIDRVVVSLDGSVINTNPATYTYPVTTDVGWRHGIALDQLSLPQVLAQYSRGAHPGNALPAVDHAYVQVTLNAPDATYSVDICGIPHLEDRSC